MKKLGAITIDEKKKRFKIDGDFTVGSKDGAIKKLAKGSAAVMTLGATVAAEKAVKGVKNMAKSSEWHDFSEYISYKVDMQNVRERQSGHSGTKVLGVRIGGSSSKIKSVTHSYDIIIQMNDLDNPFITIPIIKKPLSGSTFDKAIRYADETKFALDYISRNQ